MRLKRVPIAPENLILLMTAESEWRAEAGIPGDAQLRGCTIDPYADIINLFIEHSSFPELPKGEVAPILEVKFRRL
jgi:hypothetical protein